MWQTNLFLISIEAGLKKSKYISKVIVLVMIKNFKFQNLVPNYKRPEYLATDMQQLLMCLNIL